MPQSIVLTDIDDRGVATITLNRPEVHNAYNAEMIQGLIDAAGSVAADDRVRVVVIRGNGKHFQAGADLKWVKANRDLSEAENLVVSNNTTDAVRGLNQLPKPTIALVHGGCFGGGIGMIAACDVVIASQETIFAITETRWGLVASPIIPQLNARMGLKNVRRYAMSSERFGAERAKELGLVDEVCPTGKLDETASPIIEAFLLAGPDAMAQTKLLALELAGQLVDDPLADKLARHHAAKRMSAEASEGLDSFIEKRQPSWYTGGR